MEQNTKDNLLAKDKLLSKFKWAAMFVMKKTLLFAQINAFIIHLK